MASPASSSLSSASPSVAPDWAACFSEPLEWSQYGLFSKVMQLEGQLPLTARPMGVSVVPIVATASTASCYMLANVLGVRVPGSPIIKPAPVIYIPPRTRAPAPPRGPSR